MRLIALEEHYVDANILATYDAVDRALLAPTRVPGLDELGEMRLARMDASGISLQVLSHAKPGVQNLESPTQATALAAAANDALAEAVAAHPHRFAGFATLATQAPEAAAAELERTVQRYGFKGAMVNGHTQGAYLDDRRFWPIFEAAQALDVPLYLHPANPHPAVLKAYYEGFPALGYAPWGYAVETGTHLLRIMLSGVFDAFPRLQMVVGHMGEFLPFALWRADGRLTPLYPHLKKQSLRQTFLEHVHVTTAGVFSTPELRCTADVMGIDRLLFSVDYPFESNEQATTWFRQLDWPAEDLAKLAHVNAERLLKLSA